MTFESLFDCINFDLLFQNGELSGYRKNGKELVGKGIAFDIIHILQEKYNFNYTIVAPQDNVFLSSTKKLGAKDMVVNGVSIRIIKFFVIFMLLFPEGGPDRGFSTSNEQLPRRNRVLQKIRYRRVGSFDEETQRISCGLGFASTIHYASMDTDHPVIAGGWSDNILVDTGTSQIDQR